MKRTSDHGAPSPNQYIYNINTAPKTHETLEKRDREIFRARGPEICCEIVPPKNDREVTPMKS